MNTAPESPRMNHTRRAFGIVLGFSPLVLLITSLVDGIINGKQPNFVDVGFMVAASVIVAVNLYTSLLGPYLFRLRHGSMENYRFVSGIPMIGTLLIVLSAVIGFGVIGSALIGIILFTVDSGGSGWFVIATWKDKSLWDK